MLELDPANALSYLHDQNRLPRDVSAQVDPLAWGVSNLVLRVTPDVGEPFVVKQSREQLRTKDPWFSRLDRIWREVGVMRLLQPLLPDGVIPRVLFEDRDNYLFAMQAAPADHVVWKERLLAGIADATVAVQLGAYLAAIHRYTAFRADLQQEWGDTEVFVQLRVDPFYRKVAERHPDMQPAIQQMIDEMFATDVCLVHADFSPKNVLISSEGITLVDFETAHYGDPAFDLGFFLSHLLLKSILHAKRFDDFTLLTTVFWKVYLGGLGDLKSRGPFLESEMHRRTMVHLAGCMWARIDGTSKVDYLPDAATQQLVRDFCRSLFQQPPADWPATLQRLKLLL